MATGEQIKNIITGSGLKITEAATLLGISRGKLYHQLNKSNPADWVLNKVKVIVNDRKINKDIEQEIWDSGILSSVNENSPVYLSAKDELIDSLKQTIASQNVTINLQAQLIEQLQSQANATPARKSA